AAELLSMQKKQLEELDNLIKSVFHEMFGDPVLNENNWPIKTLNQISEIVSGITKGRKLSSTDIITRPYMRVANVKDSYIDLTEIKTIEISKRELEQYVLQEGDLLLTEGGDPDKLGRGAVWKGYINECVHQNHIFRVRVDSAEINPEYMSMLIGSTYGKKYFLRAAKQTTGIASINMTQLKKFPVIIPPLPLQNQFATIVEKIEEQKPLVQKALDESQYLFDSLMDRYFGE
ncbi:MAG: restriction endonuclease subunit S, partial [Deltaproteobacteria bacterium]